MQGKVTGQEAASRLPRIGVVALQGDFDAHLAAVAAAGGVGFPARSAADIEAADALILPGGESTTIGKLMVRYGMDTAIRDAHAQNKPIFGTCAGMILLAKRIGHGEKRGGQPTLGLMDITVARNAFGRQIDSFETDIDALDVSAAGTLRGVFIRAPFVEEVGAGVQVLATFQDRMVLVRQNNLLASAFHPELTRDTGLHRYFLDIINRGQMSDNSN